MSSDWTEHDIQALKAQEAKDLAIEFLHQLEAKEQAPITPGQVQLQELQFALRLKEAEAEDNRLQEAHAAHIKELELEIEREKSKQATANSHADRLRQEHARLIERSQEAQESLSVQLEQATREHNVKLESLDIAFREQSARVQEELAQLESQKSELQQTIAELTDLSEVANDVAELQQEIETRRTHHQREIAQLEEAIHETQFEKNRKISQVKRDQEIELAELEGEHRKQVLQRNLEAARSILGSADLVAIPKAELDELQSAIQRQRQQDETAINEIRREAEDALKRTYNITTTDVLDVTELFYREKSLAHEVIADKQRIEKLEAEINRMRQHIEQEPDRIAKAVQAAKVQVENHIEQSRSR